VIDLYQGEARIRLAIEGGRAWDALVSEHSVGFVPADKSTEPDALLTAADEATWEQIAANVRGGMTAFRARRLQVRRNLHLGVGFLAATSGITGPGRLRFERVATSREEISIMTAGVGEPVVCLPGLGGTKSSFLSTINQLADDYQVISVDLPGFGDSDKPIAAAYDAPYFARAVGRLLEAMGIERAHLVGNSMGGRVAIEVGLTEPERVGKITLLSPAMAALQRSDWRFLLQAPLARLGLLQPAPRAVVEPIVRSMVPGGNDGWAAAGVDEFLRAFLTPRGRAAFYESARNILLDEPHGERGLWTRLAELSPDTLFIWGRHDQLVPIAFMKHVESTLPAARHVELDCGHVPQVERPRETHAAIREHLTRA